MSYESESESKRLINKHLALRQVFEAKSAHLKWRAYALGMVENVDCPPECAPLSSAECEFGKWYFGQGKELLEDTVFYHSLEPPHEILHALYWKIYGLARDGELDEARRCLPSLREASDILLQALSYLEAEIAEMPPHRP